MKLSAISTRAKSQEGVWFEPTMSLGRKYENQTGPFGLLLAGSNSDHITNALKETRIELLERLSAGLIDEKQFSAEFELALLVKGTLDWRNAFEGDDGQPLEFTPENLREVYLQLEPVRIQAVSFRDRAENFFADASAS